MLPTWWENLGSIQKRHLSVIDNPGPRRAMQYGGKKKKRGGKAEILVHRSLASGSKAEPGT